MDISMEKPPPKPPHNNSFELISPMTNLANNFSSQSTIKDNNNTLTTPTRGTKLCFNSSEEQIENQHDMAIDLNPEKVYSQTEANQILQKTHSEDTKRFEKSSRRSLFTKKETKFNKLRRMASCGNQLPRSDEKFIGRKVSKTVDETNRFYKNKNTPNSSKSEVETDRLFEIAIRSRSCSRHRSDSVTPLRKHSSAKSNALEPDDLSPPCSPLRLNNFNSSENNNNNNNNNFDFDRFSDDGFMEEDEEIDQMSDLENNDNNQITSTPTRQQFPRNQVSPNQPQSQIEISPLVAPLLAKNRNNNNQFTTNFSTPNSMNKLLNGKIQKGTKKSIKRGLFQEKTPKSILKLQTIDTNSPRNPRTPSKRKFAQICDSPIKRFQSPDTPSKIRCRRRKLSFSRTKSVTYNVTAMRNPLEKINQNLLNSPGLTGFSSSSIGSKNYRCSTNPEEQEQVKMSLDRISSCENVYSGNHRTKKLDLKTVPGSGKHPQLTYITGSTLKNLMENGKNAKFEILDCRYPYEYKGGHIKSALNIPTLDELFKQFFNPETSIKHKYPPNDTVLIFHCEFSSERAPKMMKKLREIDRKRHKYPDLKYPELYLLKDGYKEFYEKFSEFCDGGYVPMLDVSYKQDFDDFRKMREKSKTWSDNSNGNTNNSKFGKRGKRRLF